VASLGNLQLANEKKQLTSNQAISIEEITINGSSSLITSEHLSKLKEWIPKPSSPSSFAQACRLDLLYKGSQAGFTAKKFHEKCDNKSPTISFIKSKEYGRIFGGYTVQNWTQTTSPIPAHYERKDDTAFIFSLTHNEKYPVIPSKSAINIYQGNPGSSVKYGNSSADILIRDTCNTVDNHSSFPGSYKCSKFPTQTEESKAYLAGSYNFKVEEIEVYKIVWI